MTRRDPFGEIENLFERMDQELEKLGAGLERPRSPGTTVDVVETADGLQVIADLPGFDPDAIDVELHEDALTIGATREEIHETGTDADEADASEEAPESGTPRYHRRERRYGSVSRRIPLPVAVEADGTTASYDDGVLTVSLPKRTESASSGHRIDVE
ncbi:Hsp20/alpha crystallin family protein [Halorubrum tibetense]|uniref:Hsp20/alpha crystallin family protein n=1 Tax=Halorubrum tibetense TaxID=175631 RepID=A0ABD5SAX2_9EURY